MFRSSRGQFAPYVIAVTLLSLAALMLLFSLYAFLIQEPFWGFLATAGLAGLLGLGLSKLGQRSANPSRREALISVLLLWLVMPAFGALPFAWGGHLSPLNAFFEAMSGFTATGATVLTDFASFPQSLFMWRALMQWFGGIGIIVLFIAVLPQLAIAGRQLFFAEAPGPIEEKLSPRLRQTATSVLYVYVGLTVVCLLAYWIAGMSFFDAITHAFTTLAAGGFSPEGRSFEAFSPVMSWIAIVFMAFAGMNFALLYRAFTGRVRTLWQDIEFRVYLIIVVVSALLITLAIRTLYTPAEAFQHGFFQALSILTTTGYASTDYAQWPETAQMLLVILMFIGGSAGSAAGGVKIIRWLMIAKNSAREVRRSLHPRGVFPLRLGGAHYP